MLGAVLSALHRLAMFRGQHVVITCGTAAVAREALGPFFARDLIRLQIAGIHPVVIQDGASFVSGELVDLIAHQGGQAAGLRGSDARLIVARPRLQPRASGLAADGLDGDVEAVHPDAIQRAEEAGRIPVIEATGADRRGRLYDLDIEQVARAVSAILNAAPRIAHPTRRRRRWKVADGQCAVSRARR